MEIFRPPGPRGTQGRRKQPPRPLPDPEEDTGGTRTIPWIPKPTEPTKPRQPGGPGPNPRPAVLSTTSPTETEDNTVGSDNLNNQNTVVSADSNEKSWAGRYWWAIAIGVLLLFLVIVGIVVFILVMRRKKKQKEQGAMGEETENAPTTTPTMPTSKPTASVSFTPSKPVIGSTSRNLLSSTTKPITPVSKTKTTLKPKKKTKKKRPAKKLTSGTTSNGATTDIVEQGRQDALRKVMVSKKKKDNGKSKK